MKRIATLDLRRHLFKLKEKGRDGQTHIDEEKSKPLAAQIGAQYPRETYPRIMYFHGQEVRTSESMWLIIKAIPGEVDLHGQPIKAIGGDKWTQEYAFTKELQAELRSSGRKDYLKFLIEKLGKERVVGMAVYALSGVYEMFGNMAGWDAPRHGIAIGHSPDMLMFVPWALMGFPDYVTRVPHGDANLPEGEGYRVHLMEDGSLQLGEHLSLD